MTDDDPLLRACSELEREDEAAYPEIWEHALAGRASFVAARNAPTVRPDEAKTLRALFDRPIAVDEVEALVGRALAAVKPAQAPAAPPTDPPHSAAILPLRRHWRGLAVLSGLAAAAALVVLMLPPADPVRPGHYELSLREPGVEPVRSTPTTPRVHRYVAASTIDWVWSPDVAVETAARIYVVARDDAGDERLLAPPITRSPSGTLHLRGPIGQALGLGPGRWHLRFLVTAGAQPGNPAAARQALAAGTVSPAGELELELLH